MDSPRPSPSDRDTLNRFLFEHAEVRGEVVRLDATWRAVLACHDYPEPVRNLLGDPPQSLEPSDVPRCVFAAPEIAHVGPLESQCGESVRVSRFSFGALGKSHCDEETEGFVKLLVDVATERIRGATIVGANASSLIHYAVVAMQHGLTAKQLARTITAHPTLPEGITEAAAHLYGESLCVAARPVAGTARR